MLRLLATKPCSRSVCVSEGHAYVHVSQGTSDCISPRHSGYLGWRCGGELHLHTCRRACQWTSSRTACSINCAEHAEHCTFCTLTNDVPFFCRSAQRMCRWASCRAACSWWSTARWWAPLRRARASPRSASTPSTRRAAPRSHGSAGFAARKALRGLEDVGRLQLHTRSQGTGCLHGVRALAVSMQALLGIHLGHTC